MRVLMISPGYPVEMQHFTRGLAEVGAKVVGLADQPAAALPQQVRACLDTHIHVRNLWDTKAVIQAIRQHPAGRSIERVESQWEPAMTLAAEIREALGLPGMSVEQTRAFRDKEIMKQKLEAAGLRTPKHARASTDDEIREAAERIGFPLILKPIAGAGSADTHEVHDAKALEQVIKRVRHVPELSVEEFIEGEEYTFDTVCVNGEVKYFNVSWYRPKPLIARTLQWVSPQTVCLRRADSAGLKQGIKLGQETLKALGFQSGFTHMEWFLTPAGEAVFGEIGARPPGARSVDLMNYASDLDLYTGWADAVVHGKFRQEIHRRYNSVIIFKRAQGEGRIQSIQGLRRFLARYGEHVVNLELLPIGAPRRNWKATLVSDGFCVVRHPELQKALSMADQFGEQVQLYAG